MPDERQKKPTFTLSIEYREGEGDGLLHLDNAIIAAVGKQKASSGFTASQKGEKGIRDIQFRFLKKSDYEAAKARVLEHPKLKGNIVILDVDGVEQGHPGINNILAGR